MFVDFWDVGATAPTAVRMSTGDICLHLLADWVPSLPASVGTSFIGWPPFLLESRSFNGRDVMTIHKLAGRTERQWKSVLSWMLGIAGTRHVLRLLGYRWIAPLSAFYPDAAQFVDLSQWHVSFPRSSIVADRDPQSASRLRPDYVALRSTGGGTYDWAVAESKGTKVYLGSKTNCPRHWANQARNVVLYVNDGLISIPRHFVIATRVNPNASRASTRRIQLRAWNHREQLDAVAGTLPPGACADIASAHLFGLFRGLGLRENAIAIALSVQARSEVRQSRSPHALRRRGVGSDQRKFLISLLKMA